MEVKEIRDFNAPEYAFLSNRYPNNSQDNMKIYIELEGIIFTSVEAAYQAAKTRNPDERRKICAMTAEEAKAYGHSKQIRFRSDWHDIRINVMLNLVWQKFYGNKELREKLLATEDAILIKENNEGDTFWGVCNGVGENHIGKILMDVRQKLRDCSWLK